MNNKTNTEVINHIMEYSKHGALMQAFIMDALTKYSQHIISQEAEVREQLANSIVHPDAWIGCAKELNKYLNKAY